MSDWEDFEGFEVLASDPEEPAPASRHLGRRIAIGGVAAAVAGVAAAGYIAYGALSGGGAQPETVVPASAAAYAEVDLDPAAGQKIAAARFLHRFPQLAKSIDKEGDVGQSLVSDAFKDSSSVNYDRDLKPWVGSRVGVALVPNVGGEKLTYELAVQVKDEAAARRILPDLMLVAHKANASNDGGGVVTYACDLGSGSATSEPSPGIAITQGPSSDCATDPNGVRGSIPVNEPDPLGVLDRSPEGWTIQGGYVILAPTQKLADALASAAASSALSDDKGYGDDVRPLGDHVASIWEDAAALKDVSPSALGDIFSVYGAMGIGSQGRTALALKFTSSSAEVVGWTTAKTAGGSGHTMQLGALPYDTMVGVEATGAADSVRTAWASYAKMLEQLNQPGDPSYVATLKQQYGLVMPDDLVSLIGTDVLFAASPRDGAVHYGVRATMPGDAADHWLQVIAKFNRNSDFLQLDGVTKSSTGLSWSDKNGVDVMAGPEKLSENEDFQKAVPGFADATWAAYVDFPKLVLATHSTNDVLQNLGTLGVTMTADGDRTKIFVRVTGN